jgi:hypothetical protein
VAPAVEAHFQHARRDAGDDTLASLPPAPAREDVEAIVDVAFWASLRREEGRSPRISLAEVASDIGATLIAVYVPQAPIPTSGFLLYLPRSALKPLAIPPDEALKRVISLGIIREENEPAAK